MKSEDYLQGYRDGMSYDKRWPMTFQFMGMNMEELAKLVCEQDQAKINARQKREEFRAKLADLGRSEETAFSSKVLEAYDMVHCPELRRLSPQMEAICSIMTELEVRSGPDYDKKYVAYPSVYGAGCLIDGLRNKGYEIVKINQK